MQVKQFKVTLLENVVLNERAASEGKHRSLDYLPGAAFLGAVANRLYNELLSSNIPENDAYTVFHSGKVRFGNALPLTDDGYLSYPTPFCWYAEKYEKDDGIFNYQFEDNRDYHIQPEAWHKNHRFISSKNSKTKFPKFLQKCRMNTAIDFDKGIAKDEQFFGYYSLPKGRQFVFNLEADDIAQKLFDDLVNVLTNRLKLGCSRSAEYGAVKIEPLVDFQEKREIDSLPDNGVTLWLLADAAFQDNSGQPILNPTAQNIGLPKHFKLAPNKTFLRNRRYAPFNIHRGSRELERVVLSMGSVLHFSCQNDEGVDTKTLQDIQDCGIGLYRQTGLGRVWINPPTLTEPEYKPLSHSVISSTQVSSSSEEPPQDSIVYAYLENRREQNYKTQQIEKIIYKDKQNNKDWISELKLIYESARLSSQGASQGEWIGPSPNQWGRVREIANTTSEAQLEKMLFEGVDAVCKENDSQWVQKIYLPKHNNINDFRTWFRYKIQQISDEQRKLLPKIVSRFAHLARDVAINKARRK